MYKSLFIFLLFFAYCLQATGQKMAGTSDSLLMEELKMTRYDKDTSAGAVILSDQGIVQLAADKNEYDFKKFYLRTLKIKILSKKGLSYGTYTISLHNHNNFGDEIDNLTASTYNLEDGRIISSPFVMSELKENNLSMQSTTEKISLPNVKVGSVIYISYTIKSPYNAIFHWNFQRNIPTISSQFSLIIPPFCHFRYLMENVDSTKLISTFQRDETDRKVGAQHYEDPIYSYALKDIPAFTDEALISTQNDYLMQIHFQITKWDSKGFSALSGTHFTTTWIEFTNKLLLDYTYFGGYLYSKENYLNKTAAQLGLSGKPQAEKVKVIVNYVKTNYRWNNTYDILSDKTMNDFISDKSGNSAAINLFLTALLKAADINAYPVLVSTRSHGKIKDTYPFYDSFNDVICYIKTDSLSLLLDATEPLLSYSVLPSQCANDIGYIVQKGDSAWIDVKPQMSAKISENIVINIPANHDSLNCKFTLTDNGYKGFDLRKLWKEGYKNFSSGFAKDTGMKIKDSIKAFSLNSPEEPFTVIFSSSIPLVKKQNDSSAQDKIIFCPFLNEPLSSNPLKYPDRQYPIDLHYPQEFKYLSYVVIPAGYKLHQIPEEVNLSVANNTATYTYKIKHVSDTVIQFTSDLSFNIPIYQPSDYKEFKNLLDVAIKKGKERIILESN